jgi:hypothetical protein
MGLRIIHTKPHPVGFCTFIHTPTHKYIRIHTHNTHMYMYAQLWSCLEEEYADAYVHIHIHAHTYYNIYIYAYTHICICKHSSGAASKSMQTPRARHGSLLWLLKHIVLPPKMYLMTGTLRNHTIPGRCVCISVW